MGYYAILRQESPKSAAALFHENGPSLPLFLSIVGQQRVSPDIEAVQHMILAHALAVADQLATLLAGSAHVLVSRRATGQGNVPSPPSACAFSRTYLHADTPTPQSFPVSVPTLVRIHRGGGLYSRLPSRGMLI